ncbi:hypothetical protein DM02DRAFT_694091 [Periconia macrospinosa]|uniref:BTB domain-containing protein n=1 Tax=Periconia macrospinosa TaxID=97972 RepID=A0A2V1D7T5_9PLEO|nr:hypothetical protein DM02DRAFT_694091 [Periconia macrospinosa]
MAIRFISATTKEPYPHMLRYLLLKKRDMLLFHYRYVPLRDEDKFTDLVLAHDAGNFSVHRIIVCPQSKVFHKACTGGFQEEYSGIISMGQVSHTELGKLVAFFYQADYSSDMPSGPEISPLQLHVRMFAIADQYEIPRLAAIAADKYSSECTAS